MITHKHTHTHIFTHTQLLSSVVGEWQALMSEWQNADDCTYILPQALGECVWAAVL